jgi:hypothetical protein
MEALAFFLASMNLMLLTSTSFTVVFKETQAGAAGPSLSLSRAFSVRATNDNEPIIEYKYRDNLSK